MSFVTSYYHIVFATYKRRPVLSVQYRQNLFRVLSANIAKKDCKALIINGVEDHVHILLSLNPNVALSNLMRDLKSQSSYWMSKCGYFPSFEGWSAEYGAFSLSASHRQSVYEYIRNQEVHHSTEPIDKEINTLVTKNGLQYQEW